MLKKYWFLPTVLAMPFVIPVGGTYAPWVMGPRFAPYAFLALFLSCVSLQCPGCVVGASIGGVAVTVGVDIWLVGGIMDSLGEDALMGLGIIFSPVLTVPAAFLGALAGIWAASLWRSARSDSPDGP